MSICTQMPAIGRGSASATTPPFGLPVVEMGALLAAGIPATRADDAIRNVTAGERRAGAALFIVRVAAIRLDLMAHK